MTEPITRENYSNYDSSLDVFAVNRILLVWFLAFSGAYVILPEADWTDLFVAVGMVCTLWLLTKRGKNRFLSLAGIRKKVNLIAVVGILLLSLLAETGLILFFEAFAPQQLDAIALVQTPSTRAFILALLSIGLLTPFIEEYLFRWVMLRAFASVRSPLFAALFSSFLFALAHGSPVYAVIVFPMGFMLALFVLKTRQLGVAVLVHILFNIYALTVTQFLMVPETSTEVLATPLVGVGGLAIALGALLLAILWLGFPSRKASTRGPLWSASLVLFILINAAFSIVVTFSV